jgi:hypothetical protein
MDQGIIAAVKMNYRQRLLAEIVEKIDRYEEHQAAAKELQKVDKGFSTDVLHTYLTPQGSYVKSGMLLHHRQLGRVGCDLAAFGGLTVKWNIFVNIGNK